LAAVILLCLLSLSVHGARIEFPPTQSVGLIQAVNSPSEGLTYFREPVLAEESVQLRSPRPKNADPAIENRHGIFSFAGCCVFKVLIDPASLVEPNERSSRPRAPPPAVV
jgi:hypothetical protein